MISQDERWELHYSEIMQFMKEKKRRPSKHFAEDRAMLNWIKYNKKLVARHELPADRQEKFKTLLQTADEFRRVNQYAYGSPKSKEEKQQTKELPLFE